jgi:general secretion pathway protein G
VNKLRIRSGFTLAEVLVMLAILAILVAVLVPTVTNQIRKGEINAVTGDLTNLRSGIEAYLSDVGRYPDAVDQLVSKANVDLDISDVAVPTGLQNRWDGPYIDKIDVASGMPTGFGGLIANDFATATAADNSYLVIEITGVAESDFADVDETLDGSTNSSTGRLLWVTAASGTIRYLALPIS